MAEFDELLRQAMSDGRNHRFDARFIENLKREIDRRPEFEAQTEGESFGGLFR